MNGRLLLWAALCCQGLLGCSGKPAPPRPDLPEARLVPVLADLHLAEALLTDHADKRLRDSLMTVYTRQILTLHGVQAQDVEQSLDAYFADPQALQSLYAQVEMRLEQQALSAPTQPDRPGIDERPPAEDTLRQDTAKKKFDPLVPATWGVKVD